ncbi:MAG TPA: hypothetical protein VFM70_02000 [Salinimicrobium sp.]|nr:hypothetical protein [Salinimicrobium sp.]
MKKSLFLYLFVFALLIIVFQYVNARKMLEAKNDTIQDLQEEAKENSQITDSLENENVNLQYFSLLKNDRSMTFFEKKGFEADQIAKALGDAIIEQNTANEDNPLVPFAGMKDKMRINKIKVLNHKWIIANFTDGQYWGEVFLSYEINENNEFVFNVEKAFLYPQD